MVTAANAYPPFGGLNVRPAFPIVDLLDSREHNPVVLRDGCIGAFAATVPFANSNHLLGGKLRFAVLFALFCGAHAWMANSIASLLGHISIVVKPRPKKQMTGVDARGRITSMKNRHPTLDSAIGNLPRQPMSKNVFAELSAPTNGAVPFYAATPPDPAVILRTFLNLLPETVFNRLTPVSQFLACANSRTLSPAVFGTVGVYSGRENLKFNAAILAGQDYTSNLRGHQSPQLIGVTAPDVQPSRGFSLSQFYHNAGSPTW